MTLQVGLALTLVLNGLTLLALERAWHSEALAPHRLGPPSRTRLTPDQKLRLYLGDVVLSLTILFGGTWLLGPWMFRDGEASAARIALEAFALLFVYDGLYYAMHRFLFHHKKLMRFMHGLHHQARAPNARESLLTHPLEVTAGLGLLLTSAILIGSVHVPAFLLANLTHSELNLVNHTGLAFPRGPLRLLNGWTRFHYGHHGVDMDANYATLSPMWDWMFKTWV